LNLSRLTKKLILGTVQLGLPYGINNRQGKPAEQEAFRILDEAFRLGITLLDSAEAYGDSLPTIGRYLQSNTKSFKVISKFISDDEPLASKVDRTLGLLNGQPLYGFLYHRFADYQQGNFQQELIALKSQGKIIRIGASIYSSEQLQILINDPTIDVIQLPFNLFDAGTEKKELLKKAKAAGKEIHVRSVFLQGLFFKDPGQLTGNLKELQRPLIYFRNLLEEHGIDVRGACLNFALHQSFIDYVIIGVESYAQLAENANAVSDPLPNSFIEKLDQLPPFNEALLNPSNWKL
jgi:aryl-alcohol dehydrogenase-like predicted oxidoreductase